MHLREDEHILKIFHHHPTPFVFDILKVIVATFPFFLVLFLFKETMSTKWFVLLHVIIFGLFAFAIVYMSVIFWLDKVVVTNERVIYINWKSLFIREEAEAFWAEIQDVKTQEKGFLSYFWVFDYGYFRIETAASHVTINFMDAPDPEGMRQFIYHVRQQ